MAKLALAESCHYSICRHPRSEMLLTLLLSIAWFVVVAVLLLRAVRQGGVVRRLDPSVPVAERSYPTVEIIVPARDEAANIEACLAGVLRQSFPAVGTAVTVVDDGSVDDTAAIVERLARGEGRLSLVPAPPLPPGWTGKTHACWVAARRASSDWLCFVDADVFAEHALLSSAMAYAEANRLDFLSLTPRQLLLSFAERLVMPCGLYLLAFTQDLAPMQAPRGTDATATGQFILVRRDAYMSAGGHEAVRGAISEDVALARLMKRAGHRVSIAGGDRLLSTRMYTGWATLWPGVSKNLVDMLGGRSSTVAIAFLGILLAWTAVVLPWVDALSCSRGIDHGCVALAVAATGSAAAFALHIAGSFFFRIPVWYGLLFPLGYTAGALMALDSVRRRSLGRTRWKGRTYP